jgi:serine/threonine protein kinase
MCPSGGYDGCTDKTTFLRKKDGERAMIPQVGQRFGPYEILGTLGGGAMGMVFRAWDRRLQREVALKVLQENYQMPGMR